MSAGRNRLQGPLRAPAAGQCAGKGALRDGPWRLEARQETGRRMFAGRREAIAASHRKTERRRFGGRSQSFGGRYRAAGTERRMFGGRSGLLKGHCGVPGCLKAHIRASVPGAAATCRDVGKHTFARRSPVPLRPVGRMGAAHQHVSPPGQSRGAGARRANGAPSHRPRTPRSHRIRRGGRASCGSAG